MALLVEGRLRVGEIAAIGHDPTLDRYLAAAFVLVGQHVHVAGGRIGEHAEFELGGLAELILELLRVLQAGNLDEDAVGPLLLDRGFPWCRRNRCGGE